MMKKQPMVTTPVRALVQTGEAANLGREPDSCAGGSALRPRCTVEIQVPSAVMTAVYQFRPGARSGPSARPAGRARAAVRPGAEGTAERPAASGHTLRHQFRRTTLRRRQNYQIKS